jgi:hypothetical protein
MSFEIWRTLNVKWHLLAVMLNLFQHPKRKVSDLLSMWLSEWGVETSSLLSGKNDN